MTKETSLENPQNFNRIVAYGCSFTAGQELGDAYILGMSHEEVDALKIKHGHGVEAYKKIYGYLGDICEKHSKTLSWVNQLADKLGVPCLNMASHGGSMQQMVFKIFQDIQTNKLTDQDFIIVGITSPYRFFYLGERKEEITQVFSFRETWLDTNLYDALIDTYANDLNIMYNYLKDIKYLDDLASLRFRGRMILVPTVLSLDSWKKNCSAYKPYLPWLDDIIFENLILEDYSLSNVQEELRLKPHGWQHPRYEVHQKFSQVIYDELSHKGIVND